MTPTPKSRGRPIKAGGIPVARKVRKRPTGVLVPVYLTKPKTPVEDVDDENRTAPTADEKTEAYWAEYNRRREEYFFSPGVARVFCSTHASRCEPAELEVRI